MPFDWSKFSFAIGPAHFTVANARPRLAALDAVPWEDFWKAAAPLAMGKG
jgi:bifunctional non-homologous end joining protein LigD